MSWVYAVGVLLSLSFVWVVWPYLADILPQNDQDKAISRMEREHPEAEVFTLPSHDLKKNP